MTSAVTQYIWSPTATEPYGEMTQRTSPLGRHLYYGYTPGAQQGGNDFGLPTSVDGDSFTQQDGTLAKVHTTYSYDSYGNTVGYNNGSGGGSLSYDSLNRPITSTDPDNVTTRTCYYANGQVKAKQTARQFALDGAVCGATSVQFAYDLDGNETAQTHHYNNQSGSTSKWYDGADRLVEVQQPWSSTDHAAGRDYYPFAWMRRYLYDPSQNGSTPALSINGVQLSSHGAVAKVQEFLSAQNQSSTNMGTSSAAGSWSDVRGYTNDVLDRTLKKYYWRGSSLEATTSTYDAVNQAGLLASVCDAVSQCIAYTYDAAGKTTGVTFSNSLNATPNRTYAYDADGSVTDIWSSTYGTHHYAFDADGEVTQSVEPTGSSSVTSPATLAYSYYPSGKRATISVTSSAFTQQNAFSYSYRADGKLSSTTLNYTGHVSSTMTFGYSTAGRVTSRAESTSGSAAYQSSWNYDSDGDPLSVSLPGGSYLNCFAYDPESLKTQECYNSATASNYGYNVRGEMLTSPGASVMSANGYMVHGGGQYSTESWDAYEGIMTGVSTSSQGVVTNSKSYQYDNAGRQAGSTCDINCTSDISRKYDAENHLIYEQCLGCYSGALKGTYGSQNYAYNWGPNGHPIQVGSSAIVTENADACCTIDPGPVTYESLHWDGDTLLFTTNASGQLDDLKFGSFADYTPLDSSYSGLTVWDRDTNGSIVGCHNSAVVVAPVPPSVSNTNKPPCSAAINTPHVAYAAASTNKLTMVGHGGIMLQPNTDGYSDGVVSIQGVRTYDPQIGTWTTPDPLEGNLQDPTSQHQYAWNRNNANAYQDPTGLDTMLAFDPNMAAGFGHSFMVVYDAKSQFGDLWSYNNLFAFALSGMPGVVTHYSGSLKQIEQQWGSKIHGFLLHTTPAQDKKMNEYWRSVQRDPGNYNFVTNNCIEHVAAALRVAGLTNEANLLSLYPNGSIGFLIRNGYLPSNLGDVTVNGSSDVQTVGAGSQIIYTSGGGISPH